VAGRWFGLLVFANFLASFGGGRVVSAGKGVTGITILGSGTILGFVAGSSAGLLLLFAVRKLPVRKALVLISTVAPLLSLALIALLSSAGATLSSSGPLLKGSAAWLFFVIVALRCSLWYAGRSLRTNVAASINLSWLGFTEASYFGGFIAGLLMGPIVSAWSISQSLWFDFTVLLIVLICDAVQLRNSTPAPQRKASQQSGPSAGGSPFWPLTLTFSVLTVSCQIVIFHMADAIARSPLPVRADPVMASFYIGVSASAVWCAVSKPRLYIDRGTKKTMITLRLSGRQVDVSFPALVTLSGVLVGAGVVSLYGAMMQTQTIWPPGGIAALLLFVAGSCVFEFAVLAVASKIGETVSGGVALALGVAATFAALALFLMLLTGARLVTWILVLALGYMLAPIFARRGLAGGQ
jgi:hypothetical protein